MIDFSAELNTLDLVNRIKQELNATPFIEVFKRLDVDARTQGNVHCNCGIKRSTSSSYCADWNLQYIGVHKSVRQRLNEHLFYSPDSKTKHKAYQIKNQSVYVCAVKYILLEPCSLREYVEHILIGEMNPPDNFHDFKKTTLPFN